MKEAVREELYDNWKNAVKHSKDWLKSKDITNKENSLNNIKS